MPYKITGKILDESGLPLYQIAQISEVATAVGQTVSGNVWTDEETGAFTFLALDPNSTIKVESHGYGVVSFKASEFPSVVKLQPALVINGTTKKKKDNTLAWVLGGVAVAIALAVTTKSKKPQTVNNSTPSKKTTKPVTVRI
ncbi:hypothetical protein [Flavobacterium sp. AG291]|uniref:hypothetical protein n=1 Tax=Flavobacterium sp. AG291 TaxID=2184000 RepID=UPI000E0BDB4E|nr:hypothetical protein [Flavobacterium sp. AG291]RDI07042.1 hypothetical protein DEU42_113142 [Flavobacterium sp. AG291]